jgi:hypothetical protein
MHWKYENEMWKRVFTKTIWRRFQPCLLPIACLKKTTYKIERTSYERKQSQKGFETS